MYYNPNNSALPGRNQIWIKCALRGSRAVLHGGMLHLLCSATDCCTMLLPLLLQAAELAPHIQVAAVCAPFAPDAHHCLLRLTTATLQGRLEPVAPPPQLWPA